MCTCMCVCACRQLWAPTVCHQAHHDSRRMQLVVGQRGAAWTHHTHLLLAHTHCKHTLHTYRTHIPNPTIYQLLAHTCCEHTHNDGIHPPLAHTTHILLAYTHCWHTHSAGTPLCLSRHEPEACMHIHAHPYYLVTQATHENVSFATHHHALSRQQVATKQL